MTTTLKNLTTVISAIVGVICLTLLVLILFGFRPYILESPSMEPIYHVGSLCWIDTKVGLDDVEVGDPIVYRSTFNALVLHRLVGIENGLYVMQGDANEITQPIELSHINYIGREAFSIPYLGGAIQGILTIAWPIVAVLIISACVPWEKIKKRRPAT